MRSHDGFLGCWRSCSGRSWYWRVPSEGSETGSSEVGGLVDGLGNLGMNVAVVWWHVEVVATSDRG